MSLAKVLQMNVRLSEGGAAGVARTLADELVLRGVASPFAYGYSSGGRPSPLEERYRSVRVTPAPIAAANRVSYSLIGRETKLRGPQKWAAFLEALESSDVIHLHAIHSHIVDTGVLFQALIKAGKPVVWTLHDQWAMTGRCAQPKDCRLWEVGCPSCPDLKAYPPARIDHAARRWVERRAMIEELQTAIPTAIVACASWLADEARRTSLRNVSVITNSVDRDFWTATSQRGSTAGRSPKVIRNLFMCRDLRDEQKVNWDLLDNVATLPGQSLTILGDHATRQVARASRVPAVTGRAELAQVMHNHDRLIFTSRVDYFPLTIVEALTAGLDVYALDSQAAREFSDNQHLHVFNDPASLLAGLRAPRQISSTPESAAHRLYFAPERMSNEYIAVYEELLGQ